MAHPILIDANSLIVRCIMACALDDLKAGEVFTGGVYGTLTTLSSILRQPELTAGPVIAFFDHGVPKFREDLFGAFYKEKRKKRREMLSDEEKEKAYQQIHTTRKMLELLGVLCLAYKDREADDGVAAAAKLFLEDDQVPVIISGDKDMWQCVAWGAWVWDLGHKKIIDTENFEDTAGVEPENYLLYKALIGDASDCIPGAPGCGPVRAVELVADVIEGSPQYQLANLCSNLSKTQKLKKLRKFEESVLDSFEWLEKVLKGTDLSASFGTTTGLAKRLTGESPMLKERSFLQFCKKLQFKSVIGDPERFLKPFREAEKRR